MLVGRGVVDLGDGCWSSRLNQSASGVLKRLSAVGFHHHLRPLGYPKEGKDRRKEIDRNTKHESPSLFLPNRRSSS